MCLPSQPSDHCLGGLFLQELHWAGRTTPPHHSLPGRAIPSKAPSGLEDSSLPAPSPPLAAWEGCSYWSSVGPGQLLPLPWLTACCLGGLFLVILEERKAGRGREEEEWGEERKGKSLHLPPHPVCPLASQGREGVLVIIKAGGGGEEERMKMSCVERDAGENEATPPQVLVGCLFVVL